jgi:factor associated with neutral sphingomyelinase activation
VTDRAFLVDVARAWHAGVLSNYEYLIALNAAAGRSFHDLSRYPVFPWVIADYASTKLQLDNPTTYRDLTKPVGALNEERLQYFLTRLQGMQDMDEKFLYGTHYSAPGYVLYYLVRSMPEHMLLLQNGKWDSPDRMFHSIAHTFQCALRNHADVKELIPEFYNANADFDFLINARGLSLGATQNGERVDDVILPPWARSGRDFIKKNRKGLESPYITSQLPRWIDLIFGSKSRGEAAMEANNLFHQMAYLGPRDLADMSTEEERFTAELQATEFGIVPDQLFVEDHLSRTENKGFDEAFISEDVGRASSKEDLGGREAWELLDNPITVIPRTSDELAAPSSDASVDGPSKSLTPIATPVSISSSFIKDTTATTSATSGKMPLRGSGQAGDSSDLRTGNSFGEMNQPTLSVPSATVAPTTSLPKEQHSLETSKSAEWDMSVVERRKIHNDAVSGCVLWLVPTAPEKSILVSTSLDGGLSVHKVTLDATPANEEQDKGSFTSTFAKFSYSTIMSRAQGVSTQSKLTEFRTHSSRDPLASLVLASDGADGHVAFAGGHDDVVLAYGINSACAVASVYSHRDAVTGLDLITRTPLDSECVLWPEKSTHILVSGSWDATIKVWSAIVATGEAVTIQREPLAELFDADSGIVCTSSLTVPTGGIVIAAGCADGSFCVWELHNDGVQIVLHNEVAKRGSGPCSVVQWIAEGGSLHLFAAFSTGKVASYTLMDGRLQRVSAVSVGVAILSMKYSNGVLLVGCADGGLRLIPVRPGSSFGTKPTLWTAVNNKNAPGISCISVTYMDTRCICCTGGEDGSVLVFELKRV